MKLVSKFLIIFLFLGINIPFNSFILDNLKNTSSDYAVLCKFSDDNSPKKKITEKNCFFCILKNEKIDDEIISTSCTNLANLNLDTNYSFYYKNFSHSLKSRFQKTRAPPSKS